MASYEPMIRMNENAFKGPGKTRPKAVRKALGDLTNSTKPQAKSKAPVKNVGGVNTRETQPNLPKVRKALCDLTNSTKAPVKNVGGVNTRGKLQPPKVGRKPLGDLTNSTKPHTKVRSPKKNSCDVQIHCDMLEGFSHNHEECIKANNQCMSLDYFLETVGLQKGDRKQKLSISVATPNLLAPVATSKFKFETPMKSLDDGIDRGMSIIYGITPAAKSPLWNMDLKDLEFSDFKLKGEFSGFKLKGEFSDFKPEESHG